MVKCTKCPKCSGRIMSREHSLGFKNPHLADEWDPSNRCSIFEVRPSSREKFNWTCKICNYKWQISADVRNRGRGCPQCAKTSQKESQSLSDIDFLYRAREIHGNKYSYDNYNGYSNKIEITCLKHGKFYQTPRSHISQKAGCLQCGIEENATNNVIPFDVAVSRLREVHGDKYEYFDDGYEGTGSSKKIGLICKIHGKSFIDYKGHRSGWECRKCVLESTMSRGERIIKELIDEHGIKYIQEYSIQPIIHPHKLRFDFYLPKLNILIEFDGIQHFKEWKLSNDSLLERQFRDLAKDHYCLINKISLIRIPYTQEDIKKFLSEHMVNAIKRGNKGGFYYQSYENYRKLLVENVFC